MVCGLRLMIEASLLVIFRSLSFTCLTSDYLSKLNIIDPTEAGRYSRH